MVLMCCALSICFVPVAEVYQGDFLHSWSRITQMRKPVIAAVSGYAVRGALLRLILLRMTEY